jgi:LAO/AO transport system kinase
MIEDHLRSRFFSHPVVQQRLPAIEKEVVEGTLPVTTAVQDLIRAFESALQGEEQG